MIEFREIMPEDAALLLRWRNSPRVAAGYSSLLPDDIELQRQWILDRRDDPSGYHWLALYAGHPFAYGRFHHWDRTSMTCRLGGYVGNTDYSRYYMYFTDATLGFIFNKLDIKTAEIRVFSDNKPAIRYNLAYGYKRQPEKDREATLDNGRPTLAFHLDRQLWQKKRGRSVKPELPVEFWRYFPPQATRIYVNREQQEWKNCPLRNF